MLNKPDWRKEGIDPDYRFSLANERTFLAWIRTALAFLAGAIALDQFAPDFSPKWLKILLAALLAFGGAILAFTAYHRWQKNERAMRNQQALPYTRFLAAVSLSISFAALCLAVVLFFL